MHSFKCFTCEDLLRKITLPNSKVITAIGRAFFSISGMATEVPPETQGISMLNLASIVCIDSAVSVCLE
jgi:hypothetical protein